MNDDIDFAYGEKTATYYGCGATLRGEFWYFGGFDRQVSLNEEDVFLFMIYFKASKIEGCKLERKEDLPFDFYLGACNTFLQPKPHVIAPNIWTLSYGSYNDLYDKVHMIC